jgi:hypothetical protein
MGTSASKVALYHGPHAMRGAQSSAASGTPSLVNVKLGAAAAAVEEEKTPFTDAATTATQRNGEQSRRIRVAARRASTTATAAASGNTPTSSNAARSASGSGTPPASNEPSPSSASQPSAATLQPSARLATVSANLFPIDKDDRVEQKELPPSKPSKPSHRGRGLSVDDARLPHGSTEGARKRSVPRANSHAQRHDDDVKAAPPAPASRLRVQTFTKELNGPTPSRRRLEPLPVAPPAPAPAANEADRVVKILDSSVMTSPVKGKHGAKRTQSLVMSLHTRILTQSAPLQLPLDVAKTAAAATVSAAIDNDLNREFAQYRSGGALESIRAFPSQPNALLSLVSLSSLAAGPPTAVISQIFAAYDTDRDGRLGASELRVLARDCIDVVTMIYSNVLLQENSALAARPAALSASLRTERFYLLPNQAAEYANAEQSVSGVTKFLLDKCDINKDKSVSAREFAVTFPTVCAALFGTDALQSQRTRRNNAAKNPSRQALDKGVCSIL